MKDAQSVHLVLLDIDGTIVDSPHHRDVTPELAQTIHDVTAKGIAVGLSTGRNYGHMMSQMRPIGFTGPFICNGGAYIVKDGVCCFESLLPLDVINAAWEQIWKNQGYIELSGRSIMHTCVTPDYTGPVFPKVGSDDYLRVMNSETEYVSARNAHISKITMLVDTQEKAEAISRYWTEGPFAAAVTLTRSFWFALEITNRGITKGSGLHLAADSVGCTPEQTMVIGDGDNDVEILRAAGVSFAMANASEAAMSAAKYRAPSVKEDGARTVLQRYILAGEPLPIPAQIE